MWISLEFVVVCRLQMAAVLAADMFLVLDHEFLAVLSVAFVDDLKASGCVAQIKSGG